ncbi:MAG: PA14 domain-containing protein [Caldilineaceae bacterium]
MKRPILTFILAMMLLLVGGSQLATAQSGNQWRIDFWPNPDWAGAPVYTQYANFADFTWGEWAPGPNLPSQNYSARLDTDAFFYAGLYRFTVLADDEVRLTINNVTYLDTIGRPQPGKTFVIDIPMAQGMSHVSVDFRQWSGPGYIHVNWQFVKENGGAPVYPTQPPTYVPPRSRRWSRRRRSRTSTVISRPAFSKVATRRTASTAAASGIRPTSAPSRWNPRSSSGRRARPTATRCRSTATTRTRVPPVARRQRPVGSPVNRRD